MADDLDVSANKGFDAGQNPDVVPGIVTPEQLALPSVENLSGRSVDAGGVVQSIGDEKLTEAKAVLADAEQSEGFKTVDEYKAATLAGNARARKDAQDYVEAALPSLLYAHSAEKPHALILCECADGRNAGPENFSKNPIVRFPARWKPMAGLIMFPSATAILKDKTATKPLAERLDELLSDDASKQEIWAQARALFSKDIERYETLVKAVALAGKRALGVSMPDTISISPEVAELADVLESTSGEALRQVGRANPLLGEKVAKLGDEFPITLELQSHSNYGSESHGCGAHGSNLNDALTLSAMNALIIQRFLQEEYPQVSNVHISLTHHFTGAREKIVDVYRDDLFERIDSSVRARISDGEVFRAQFQRDKVAGIVRQGKVNFSGIDLQEHDEYIVRVSEYHKANGLSGASVLEQCMIPNLDQMEGIVTTLIGIAMKHRISTNPTQPLFLGLDEPDGNEEVAARYHQLYACLMQNAEVRRLVDDGKLFIVRSKTRPFNFNDPDRLKTAFLDTN